MTGKRTGGVVHAVAICRDCGFYQAGFRNAQALGAAHSYRTGHTVDVEVGLAFTYGPRAGTAT